jgi:hypothetical protein
MDEARVGLGDAAKEVLSRRDAGSGFAGVIAPVADLIQTDRTHAPAVEAALGANLQALVIRSIGAMPTTDELASLSGRVVFVPMAGLEFRGQASTPTHRWSDDPVDPAIIASLKSQEQYAIDHTIPYYCLAYLAAHGFDTRGITILPPETDLPEYASAATGQICLIDDEDGRVVYSFNLAWKFSQDEIKNLITGFHEAQHMISFHSSETTHTCTYINEHQNPGSDATDEVIAHLIDTSPSIQQLRRVQELEADILSSLSLHVCLKHNCNSWALPKAKDGQEQQVHARWQQEIHPEYVCAKMSYQMLSSINSLIKAEMDYDYQRCKETASA